MERKEGIALAVGGLGPLAPETRVERRLAIPVNTLE